MYCRQCGAELREGAAFCAQCGAPTGQQQKPVDTPKDPGKGKKKLLPLVVLAIVVVVLVAGIALLVKSCSSGRGYSSADAACEQADKAMETLFTAESESDIEKACEQFVEAMPSEAVEALEDELDLDDDTEFILYLLFDGYDAEDVLEIYEDYFGLVDDLELSFTTERGDRLDSDDIEDIQDDLDDLGIDLEIDAAYEIEATMAYSYTYDDDEYEDDDYYLGDLSPIVLIRSDDTWYVWFEYYYY